ncbi:hypothetical protein LZ31DRAFT_550443 [Colletotrichum somersetense]|nr:hypothetical protein LZ31DRAFT_550443 [Colletotrichum somersetense]
MPAWPVGKLGGGACGRWSVFLFFFSFSFLGQTTSAVVSCRVKSSCGARKERHHTSLSGFTVFANDG